MPLGGPYGYQLARRSKYSDCDGSSLLRALGCEQGGSMTAHDAARAAVSAWRTFQAHHDVASHHALTVAMELLASKLDTPRVRRRCYAQRSHGDLNVYCHLPNRHPGDHCYDYEAIDH